MIPHSRRSLLAGGATAALAGCLRGDRTRHPRKVATGPRTDRMRVHDPYGSIEWSTVERHKCEFHNHPAKWREPHRVVDLYHGSGTDANGNRLASDDGYTVFSVSDMGIEPICWPWTGLSKIEGEDRDPTDLGVVAFPGAELRDDIEHVSVVFSTATDDVHDAPTRVDALEAVFDAETDLPKTLATIAHPERYYDEPAEGYARYIEDFSGFRLDHGLVGFEILNDDSSSDGLGRDAGLLPDLELWDRLLSVFMPDRPIWGFGVDDPHEFVIGQDVDVRWTEVLLSAGSFEPADQVGSRAAAMEAMWNGHVLGVERAAWDHDAEEPPTVPSVEAITVSGSTISIEATDFDHIRWMNDAGVTATGDSIEVTRNEVPYVRSELWRDEPPAVVITQPFGVTAMR